MGGTRKSRRTWLTVAAALFPGAAFAVGSVVNHVAGAVQIAFVVAGAACSSLAAYVGLRSKARLADMEIEAFSDNLCAIVENLVRLAHEPNDTGELTVQTIDWITTMAATQAGPGTRCAYYALEDGGRRLRRRGQYGDVSQAPDEYATDEPDGRDLLWALGRRTIVRIDDTLSASGYPMINLGDGYRSSVIAPVHVGERPVGVLILDAPRADAFGESGEGFVRLFSLLLGAVHGAGAGAGAGPAGRPVMGRPRRPPRPERPARAEREEPDPRGAGPDDDLSG
ncbi:GAF domain-containing protein [Streptomyces sp. NPDC004065]|uniref:GAF domain-containing protein n=1 Tax=Streptomyces sp. NPDC004065 TaxID=3364689 RepID=UPI00384D37CC